MSLEPILIDGTWRAAHASGSFTAENPSTGRSLGVEFPISSWEDCQGALDAASLAAEEMRNLPPGQITEFLEGLADLIEADAETICNLATEETGLPISPRLREVELPRTTNQLRQAAAAALDASWRLPTLDSSANIRSCFTALGPVAIFGPNNFPLAFNGLAGGDFAAAIAAGNPVIAKANPSHPATTRQLAMCAVEAAAQAGMPRGTVQLIYRTNHADGAQLVSHHRLGATAYTGSRIAGLNLKAAADAAGKPIYLELSSVNPVVFLPGALAERGEELVAELAGSCLMGAGQFCTCPNLVVLLEGPDAEAFVAGFAEQLASRPMGTLLSRGVRDTLMRTVGQLQAAGAKLVAGGEPSTDAGYAFENTLLRVSGSTFLKQPRQLQTEAFGNATLVVLADGLGEACAVARQIEGSLTATIYSASDRTDDEAYHQIAPPLRQRAGRLLNDKMPTGVAVSPAMNHGGPFPASGHPGFTAVGIPASLRRFAMLQCFDNVREDRLPDCLRNICPNPQTWRLIDGRWMRGLDESRHLDSL